MQVGKNKQSVKVSVLMTKSQFSNLLSPAYFLRKIGITKIQIAFDCDTHESTEQWFHYISEFASRGDAFSASGGFTL